MAKTRAKRMRSARGRSTQADHVDTGSADPLVDQAGHRFPWPDGAQRRRYGIDTPYLAIVNARGPWAVWKHDRANPPFIPLCLDLLGKEFWRRASNDERVFALTFWMRAAQEDDWGIVWGDPVRLCTQWGLDAGTFTSRLDWLIHEGQACYLTADEAEAVRNWRPYRAQRGGNTRGGQGQEQDKQDQAEQVKTSQEPAGASGSQGSSPSASAQQTPESAPKGQGQEQAQASQAQHSKPEPTKSQPTPQAQPEGTEPGNLPKSDPGAAGGSPRTPGGVRGRSHERPRSASHRCPDATPMGNLLGWGNPVAVEFGRAMYEAIAGHRPPQDLTGASDQVKGDVGVWVHYWVTAVEPALPVERRSEFGARAAHDVELKRKTRGIRNLGGLARKTIVPGVLRSLT